MSATTSSGSEFSNMDPTLKKARIGAGSNGPLNSLQDLREKRILERLDFFDDNQDIDNHKSTAWDGRDMQRLGRKQELTRHFRALSMLSFTTIVQATWEFVIVAMGQGLFDGGYAGMVWSFVWTFFGFIPIVASLAEMSSMSPTSGGQYHWVSEFAPQRLQKALSYFSGWQSTLAWQAGNASGPFVTGTLIQALVSINQPDYKPTNWQGTLMVIGNILAVFLANYYGTRAIPFVQNALLAVHVLLFFAVITPLWVLAPHPPAEQVFLEFSSKGGWGNMGLALMVCQVSAIWGCLGSDAAAHLSEETRDAGRTVPIAMMGSYLMNGILGIVVVTTVCFAIPNLHDALADPTGYQYLYALRGAMSDGWATVISVGILVVIFASNVSYLASTARETWAFARDKGLPFSSWISEVHPTRHIPANALILSSLISTALSLIYIGSDTAFYAIISLNVVALMITYFISIGCVLWRRIFHPETLPPARWSLGRWGLPVNVLGLLYSFWAAFWAFWPESTPVNLENLNWSVVMFGSVTILSMVLFVVRGRKVYVGPVVLVEGRNFSVSSK